MSTSPPNPRLRALVDAARATQPTAADRARVRTALAARVVLPTPVAPPAATPGAAVPAGVAAKLVAAAALVGATGFGGGFLAGTRSPPADLARHGIDMHAVQRAHVASQPREIAARANVPVPVPAPPPAPIAARSPEAPVPSPRLPPAPPSAPPPIEPPAGEPVAAGSVSPEMSSLLEETRLLRAAQTSLGAGDARAALARLDELGARHASGVLREERLAAHIVALCAVGRDEEARREAALFLAEAPLSIHAARVRASCARTQK